MLSLKRKCCFFIFALSTFLSGAISVNLSVLDFKSSKETHSFSNLSSDSCIFTSPVTQNLSSDMKGSGVRVELETSSTKNTPGRNESGCEPAKHSTRQEKMKNETNQDCIKETQMQDIAFFQLFF
jgi:hypothetical protein